MPDRFAEIRHGPQAGPVATAARRGARAAVVAGTRLVSAILAGALMAACSTSSDTSYSLFVDPAKYQYYNCAQLAADLKTWSQRRLELKSLMDRADQGAGGAAVGLIAYKADYISAGEELEFLQSAARGKKCDQDETWRSSAAIR